LTKCYIIINQNNYKVNEKASSSSSSSSATTTTVTTTKVAVRKTQKYLWILNI